jgi:phage terminase large subunit-like protein
VKPTKGQRVTVDGVSGVFVVAERADYIVRIRRLGDWPDGPVFTVAASELKPAAGEFGRRRAGRVT